ncbi:TRAP transporter large permease [Salinibacterium sp. M195]|uniref:TRAP transporter large permease n=1 Tax=Salinibacterium sp. M195 TaxID=2583374 RepID=UPI001C62F269|nr:TRAP transporter large permease [Salinibacterium sp. M195]QYH34539.1 TRAP transporter large permease [Salinibacterium sp. M195]
MVELILFGSFLGLLLVGVPVAFAMGGSAFLTIIVADGVNALFPTAGIMYASLSSETLLAIPFFILAGVIMEITGISGRLIELADAMVGHQKGGLALTTILAALLFSAISGSGPATVAALGAILIPALAKHGYKKRHAAALVASAGEMGIVIPPSIAFIVFAVVASDYERISIGRLFLAGIVPGILMAIAFYIVARLLPVETEMAKTNAKKHIDKALGRKDKKLLLTATGATTYTTANPTVLMTADVDPDDVQIGQRRTRASWPVIGRAFVRAIPGLLVPVIILGGIYGGIFTPTESAAVASVYALLVGVFVTRKLNFRGLFRVFTTAGIQAGRIMLIISAATIFAYVITRNQIASQVTDALLSLTDNVVVIILLINIMLLIAGMFLDAVSAFYLFIPLFVPVMLELGMDITTIGVVMTINLAIGLVTPPVGIDLFVAAGIAQVPFGEAVKGIWPFLVASLTVLMLLTFIPVLSTGLPDLMGL